MATTNNVVCMSETLKTRTWHGIFEGDEAVKLRAQIPQSLLGYYERGLSVRIGEGRFIRKPPAFSLVFNASRFTRLKTDGERDKEN